MSNEPGYGRPPGRRLLTAALRRAALAPLVAWAACTGHGPNVNYYYPLDDLADGRVYAYRPAPGSDSASFPGYYWFHRAVETPDSLVLTSTRYDEAGQPRQYVAERIVDGGALMRDLRLFVPTDSASVVTQAEVLEPAVFSFLVPLPGRVLVSAVRLRQNDSAAVYTITRNRHYARDTSVVVDGQTLPAQVWAVRELIEQDSAGTLSLETHGIEVYAEGVGLAYRRRDLGDGTVEAHVLTERFAMEVLEQRFGGGVEQ